MQILSFIQVWLVSVWILTSNYVAGSPGDNLNEFIDCCYACEFKRSCPYSQIHWIDPEKNQFRDTQFTKTPFVLEKLFLWDCISDCDYQCQHVITKMRIEKNEEIYQFHGKWPFVRYFSTQEFFSTIFSIANFVPHYYGFQKLNHRITSIQKSRGQLATLAILKNYIYVSIAGMFAWIASTIFHWRDLIITEKLDYFFAGLTVLAGFHAILARMVRLDQYSKWHQYFSICVLLIFSGHILRLYIDWSYTYNMRFNIFFGLLQYILLLSLAVQNYSYLKSRRIKSRSFYNLPYSRQFFKLCFIPTILVLSTAMAMSLEIFDFFSYTFQIDAHAIWHFCTIWPSLILYDFFLSDFDLVISEVTE
ncbi:Per1p NDAI_0A00520 [Naumovozyma dairenensis CBS 421]|uniref:Post-GPI attachment to proteins factor 3 n=1 Tax=Naumovozyma dairenensis (strain ATCC 10597 / BCRC 20456 / CBS 421 / NBRC 0211 / NRRL Y-12639) TaxID=1071378 RepID=G0W322_NAUDC|nr:hypothetical protein NDAI_0A00520 [Naumovozyma dairenensis CBS 421]CCD22210.1 hypothetical protein NDAI_0A00520 [Naumovozyma dairenensis CBS 421]